MKYYKLIGEQNQWPSFTVGKIYPEDIYSINKICNVSDHTLMKPDSWKEVPSGDYYVQENGKLPETWYIQITEDNKDIIKEWFKGHYNLYTTGAYYGLLCGDKEDWNKEALPQNSIIISTETFKKYVMKEKEIIGYKTPTSLWKGDIPKGAIYVKDPEFKANYNWEEDITEEAFRMPNEIVETWEAIYKEDIEFKIGDWVYWSGTDATVGQIKKRCSSFKDSWYLSETHSSCSNHNLRLATQQEILNHLQKEFTKETGIDIGSKVSQNTCKNKIVTQFILINKNLYCGKASNLTDQYFKENPDKQYQLGIKCNSYTFSVDCKLSKAKLTFGGKEVTLEKVISGVRISCDGETGTLSQIEKIYNYYKYDRHRNKFGTIKVNHVTYDWGSIPNKPFDTPINIKVGCLTGTWEEGLAILEKARSL